MRWALSLCLTFLVSVPAAAQDTPPEGATGRRTVAPITAKQQMVVAANPHATRAGLEILNAGGSAVDAAIAMGLVLTLVEPQSSGVGGGAFLLHYDPKTEQVSAFDGRETAPAAATPDQFMKDGERMGFMEAVVGGLSVGVPGELRMFELAHRQHGKLPWRRLFQPAIRLARRGFALSPRLHALLSRDTVLPTMPLAGDYFYMEGKPKPVGTVLVNRPLARVLSIVARSGTDPFYEGPVAARIVETVRGAPRNPGRMTLEDLASYQAVQREAVCLLYRKDRVCGMPPPTSGGLTTLQILGMLEPFDVAGATEAEAVHLFAEASRLAYADRGLYIADPGFVTIPDLLDEAYLERRSKLIDRGKRAVTVEPGEPPGVKRPSAPDASGEQPGTSHLVVVDRSGRAVSMTASIESAFGSHLMAGGFLLNNELTDFSFLPEIEGRPVANRVEPGKRPRSSMAPMVVLDEDGDLKMLLGSPGGSRIIEYVARVLVWVLDRGASLQEAVAAPNIVSKGGPVEIEEVPGHDPAPLKAALEARGHEVVLRDLNSGLHGLVVTPKGFVSGVDPRREGTAAGGRNKKRHSP